MILYIYLVILCDQSSGKIHNRWGRSPLDQETYQLIVGE